MNSLSAAPGAAPHPQRLDPALCSEPSPLTHYQIIRRNGAVVGFEPNKIAVALMKAFLAVHGTQGAASASIRETVDAHANGDSRLAALAPERGQLSH